MGTLFSEGNFHARKAHANGILSFRKEDNLKKGGYFI